jgi:prephenate dehydrogenase
MGFRVCVVGLGLMGGSLAMALRGFREAEIVGADTDPAARRKALEAGAVQAAYGGAADAAAGAELVVFCVYAHHIPGLLKACGPVLAPGAVLSDICGVKTPLYRELEPLIPEGADYVGVHPMAGRERDGFDNADGALYQNTGFLITPLPRTQPSSVALMEELAAHIGAARVAVSSPAAHDAIIAYTSDLMHIAAAGLCADFHPDMTLAHTAGAFRDCTRIADINAAAWTELLLSNAGNTLRELDRYMNSLTQIRRALAERDEAALYALLGRAGRHKREMLTR